MWICSRVGKGNSLSALRQIRIYGSRLRIEKIQKLTQNFEKACWRSVRISEEVAYMKKYRFLKHCLNVINTYRQKGLDIPSPSDLDPNPHKLSQYILDKYDLDNSKACLEEAQSLLDQATGTPRQEESLGPESDMNDGSEPKKDKGTQKPRFKIDKTVTNRDVQKLKKIISELKQKVELMEKHGDDPHVVGYTRSQLEKMIKL